MKKLSSRKLTLSRETINALTPQSLDRVGGAFRTTTVDPTEATNCFICNIAPN